MPKYQVAKVNGLGRLQKVLELDGDFYTVTRVFDSYGSPVEINFYKVNRNWLKQKVSKTLFATVNLKPEESFVVFEVEPELAEGESE